MLASVRVSFSLRRVSFSCLAVVSSLILAAISASVAVSGSPNCRAYCFCSICFCFLLLFNIGNGHSLSLPRVIFRPSFCSTMASSLAPTSTKLTSNSLLLVIVGHVWPCTSSSASSLVSNMSSPALTIFRLPNSHCFLHLTDSSEASSNISSPVTSPSSTFRSFT